MNEKRLSEIKDRADKASIGPWYKGEQYEQMEHGFYVARKSNGLIILTEEEGILQESDAEFIANARQDVPDLLAEVERLRATIIEAGCSLAYGESGDAHKTLYNAMSDGDYEYFERINADEEAKFEEKRIQLLEELR